MNTHATLREDAFSHGRGVVAACAAHDRQGAPPYPDGPKLTTLRNRVVIGMGLTSFFSNLGHETDTAVLPLFLASIGLGAIKGVSDATSSFVKLGAGWIGDRVSRRKPIVVGGYAVKSNERS